VSGGYTIGTTEPDRWRETLRSCGFHDVYHLPEYHRLEEEDGVSAELFVHEDGSAIIAMPILLRRIEGVPGLETSKYKDVTSVYGYPGPVSNLESPTENHAHGFIESLRQYFDKNDVVAAFSRLHPLIETQPLFLTGSDMEVRDLGQTVAIDLRLPAEAQRQQYRTNHKRDINRARRAGVECIQDTEWDYFDAFLDIYYQTMHRSGASESYFFDRQYFLNLREVLGSHLALFVALHEGSVISAAMFMNYNSIVQYHLGGTDSAHLELAPSKLMFDTVRLWGAEVGAHVFHLGGGVGSAEDSLFRFKAGFSKLRFTFRVWRMIVNRAVYGQLTEERRRWNEKHGVDRLEHDFFPAYRQPVPKNEASTMIGAVDERRQC
jgi:hypothetical protein